jgi:hypothetical protein
MRDRIWLRRRFRRDGPGVGLNPILFVRCHRGPLSTCDDVERRGLPIPSCRSRRGARSIIPIHMDAERVGWEGGHNYAAIARLRDGITPEQARAEFDVLQAQVSNIATKEAHQPVTLAIVVTALTETVVGRARRGAGAPSSALFSLQFVGP